MHKELGQIAIIFLLLLIIALNITSYVVYYLNPRECFENSTRIPDTDK